MPNAKLYSKLWYAITWERKSKEKTKEKVSTHAKLYPEMSVIAWERKSEERKQKKKYQHAGVLQTVDWLRSLTRVIEREPSVSITFQWISSFSVKCSLSVENSILFK